MSTTEEQLGRLYARIARDLSYRFDGVYTFETVVRTVQAARAELDATSRIKDYVPVLVERVARDQLTAAARPDAWNRPTVPAVLFASAPDADRSRLAAERLAELASGRVDVRVAHPLTDSAVQMADVVVTMGFGLACPIVVGTRYRDWDILSPVNEDSTTIDAIRADLGSRVGTLLVELGL